MIDPFSFGIGTAWGLFTLLCWTVTLHDRAAKWRRYRDPRSRRELLFIGMLWFIAAGWCLLLFLSVIRDIADVGAVARGLLFGSTIGVFTLAGLVSAMPTFQRAWGRFRARWGR